MKKSILLHALFFCVGLQYVSAIDYAKQNGDILFQSLPHQPIIDAIEGASGSPFSHCGILINKKGNWIVLEALGSVKETPFNDWIVQGRQGSYAAYRLRKGYSNIIDNFIESAYSYLGRPYDIHYEMDDEKIYCSELVFKAFRDVTGEDLGVLRKLGDLNWKPYEQIIRTVEQGGLPLDRIMITPKDLSEAKQLTEVYRKGYQSKVKSFSAKPFPFRACPESNLPSAKIQFDRVQSPVAKAMVS